MNTKSAIAIALLFLLLIFTASVTVLNGEPSYTAHGVITIEGDADLTSTAVDEGWNGTGTAQYPYVIDNFEIEDGGSAVGYCIMIKDVTLNVTINGCLVKNSGPHGSNPGCGVLVKNATNIIVRNTVFSNLTYGVYIDASRNVSVSNCDDSSEGTGAYVIGSSHVAIDGWTSAVSSGTNSILVYGSDNVTISNYLGSDVAQGIRIDGSNDVALDAVVAERVVGNSISAADCDNLTVSRSILSTTGTVSNAIGLSNCDRASVHDNTIDEFRMAAISITGSENFTVCDNTISRTDSENVGSGINVAFDANFTIEGNSLTGQINTAINHYSSRYGIVANNSISSATYAAYIVQCSDVLVTNNTATGVMTGIIVDTGDRVDIVENHIAGQSSGTGIMVQTSHDCTVEGNVLLAPMSTGISASGGDSIRVLNNTMSDIEMFGISVIGSHGVDISYNTINWTDIAINIEDGYDFRIIGNEANDDNQGLHADTLYDALVDSNSITNAGGYGLYIVGANSDANLTISNNHIPGAQVGMIIINAHMSVLEGNDCPGFVQYGASLSNSMSLTLVDNSFTGIGVGEALHISNCAGAVVDGGNYSNAYIGIWASDSGSSVFESVNSSFNSGSGLVLGSGCDFCLISNSTFSNNGEIGIVTFYSASPTGITVRYCHIENNTDRGIFLSYGFNCYVIGNHIANNGAEGVGFETMHYSYVYNNTFLNNYGASGVDDPRSQVMDFDGASNIWYDDVLLQGNRWSNLRNIDRDGNGIVDQVYVIATSGASIYDRYPLPYGPEIGSPSAPLDLTATVDEWYVHLEWNEPLSMGNSTLTDYQVLFGTSPDLENMMVLGVTDGLSFDQKTWIEQGNTYYYAVIARNADWFDGAPSNIASVIYAPFPAIDHDVIVIPSDQAFAEQAGLNGWQGDGSAEDPYVIEDYVIDGSSGQACILISDTTVHFIIRNCTLYQGAFNELTYEVSGVVLNNVLNGRIENCSLLAFAGHGIRATSSQVDVVGCDFHGPGAYSVRLEWSSGSSIVGSRFVNTTSSQAIYVTYSSDCLIGSNVFLNVQSCIQITNGNGNVVRDNIASDAGTLLYTYGSDRLTVLSNTGQGTGTGLSIDGNDILVRNNSFRGFIWGMEIVINGGTVEGNVLTECGSGIWMRSATDVVVQGNDFTANGDRGMYLSNPCIENTIRNNLFLDNLGYAIFVDEGECYGNVIFANYFEGNHGSTGTYDPEKGQVFDTGYSNMWYEESLSIGNYYYDWNSPDEDGDGIVDGPYAAGCSADVFPLARLFGPVTGAMAQAGPVFVNLTWSGLEYDFTDGTDGFIVYKYVESQGFVEIARVGTNWYNDTDVQIGVTYYYRIAAYLSDEVGALGVQLDATPANLPGAPENLVAENGIGQVTLTWDAPSDDGGSQVLGYTIWRGSSADALTLRDTIQGAVTTYVDLEPENGASYYYVVRAFNAVGNGTGSDMALGSTYDVPSAPNGVGAIFGNGNVTVTWNAPSSNGGLPVEGYRVTVYQDGLAIGSYDVGPSVFALPVTGLENGVEYSFDVAAWNDVGHGPRSDSVIETPATVCGAPTMTGATPGDDSVGLIWTAPSVTGGDAPASYRIYRGTSPSSFELIGTSASLQYSDGTVLNGVVYYYKVTAVNKAGESQPSDVIRTVPGLPAAPGGLTAAAGTGGIELSWSAPASNGGSAVLDYKVYRSDGTGFVYIGHVGNGTFTAYDDRTAAPGMIYCYKVSAVTANGEGAMSDIASAVLPPMPPSAPDNVTAVWSEDGVVVSWSQPVTSAGCDEFFVYRGQSEASMLYIGTVSGDTFEFFDPLGQMGQYYAVRAVNEDGESPLSEAAVAVAVIVLPPAAPSDIEAAAGDGTVRLSWSHVEGPVTGYKVYRYEGNSWTLIMTVSGTSCDDSSALNGVTYSYRVAAFNEGGEGPYGPTAIATPGTVPGQVVGLVIVNGTSSVTLNWSVPSSNGGSAIIGYKVFRQVGGTTVLIATVTMTGYQDFGLALGTEYQYWVQAVNAWGAGASSAQVSGALLEPEPAPLRAPSYIFADGSDGRISLAWGPIEGVAFDGYRVYRATGGGFALVANVTGPSFVDVNVTNGVQYQYTVCAYRGEENGEMSGVAAARPGTVPGKVTVTATGGIDSLTLSWEAPSDGGSEVIKYRVYRAVGTGGLALYATVSALGFVDSAVMSGTEYTYVVTAVNQFGEGEMSEIVKIAFTDPVPPSTDEPSAPGNVTSAAEEDAIVISWTAPSDEGDAPVSGYCVYKGTSLSDRSLYATLPAGTLSFIDADVAPGTEYFYWVSAVNAWGEGEMSDVAEAGLEAVEVPAMPEDLDATAGAGQVTIAWAAPEDQGSSPVTSYLIYRGETPAERTLIASVPGGSNSFVDAAVEEGKTYYYWIVAVSDAGEGELQSEPLTATVGDAAADGDEAGTSVAVWGAIGVIGALTAALLVIVLRMRKP